jgi:predicted amidohydrolase
MQKDTKPQTNAIPVYFLFSLLLGVLALLPVLLAGYFLHQTAWDNAWREVHEKHRLLAINLASPIQIYVDNQVTILGSLANELNIDLYNGADSDEIDHTILAMFQRMRGFNSLGYINAQGQVVSHHHRQKLPVPDETVFQNEPCFIQARDNGTWYISKLKPSPLNGDPAIIISYPVVTAYGKVKGVVLGELRLETIEELRKKIRFGNKGHSAIVDATGKVIAHPNPRWMEEMKDLSHWKIVQAMMAGKTGVTEFYSSFMKENMVAGYTTVPDIGWGIMVPQPKSEISANVNRLIYDSLYRVVPGLLVVIILAWLILRRWLMQPLRQLHENMFRLAHGHPAEDLPPPPWFAPKEIHRLDEAMRRPPDHDRDNQA